MFPLVFILTRVHSACLGEGTYAVVFSAALRAALAEGAGVPENFWTVWANLFEPAFGNLLECPTEKSLLVHGGAGGIGSTALALASLLGVRTITTVRQLQPRQLRRVA